MAYDIYKKLDVDEPFTCNYELNPEYRERLESSGLRVSGVTEDGGARIVELPGHRFYMVTGFVPQLASEENKPHPIITAFLKAAISD